MTGAATTWQVDAVVVGAGPAGCATVTILARRGHLVGVIDDGRRAFWQGETLPAGAGRVIDDVFGSDVLVRHDRADAVRAAWETPELHVTDALMHPLGESWLLDRRVFDTQARDAAVTAGAAADPMPLVASVQPTPDGFQPPLETCPAVAVRHE